MGHGKKPEGADKRRPRSFRREFLLFLVLFFVIWLFSYLLTRRLPGFVDWLQIVVAREVAFFVDLFGYRYRLDEGAIFLFAPHGGEHILVIPECTGLYTTIIYISIIGAYPAKAWQKLVGLAVGIPAIHILNLARMVFISFIKYRHPELFELFHGYLWQVGFVIFMLLLVILWMWKIARPPRRDEASAA